MKINVLEPSVYNRISAGEVVENPASVIKELCENAIDAGANSLTIRIECGGIKLIEVEDDGVGIDKEELPKTILPHATSKISDSSDLFSISTLGFRGEALASIASVSDFKIKSRYFESEVGALLHTSGGNDVSVIDSARNVGTTVTVSKLFYNTPARYKFLKSEKSEEGNITELISELILANPQVSIKYYIDGKIKFESRGEGLFSAIQCVFPKEISDSLLAVTPTQSSNTNVQVSGFIGTPTCFRHNRGLQTVIVNGRIITDQTISATVQNAYGERLMHRCFPVFVLNVLIPFESVDVNVHPNKREVRFERPREVYGAIYNAVKNAIEDYEYNKRRKLFNTAQTSSNNIEKESIFKENEQNIATFDENENLKNCDNLIISYDNSGHKSYVKSTNLSFSESAYPAGVSSYKNNNPIIYQKQDKSVDIVEEKTTSEFFPGGDAGSFLKSMGIPESMLIDNTQNDEKIEVIEEKTSLFDSLDLPESQQKCVYKVVGQFFNTYIIVEIGDRIIVVDQHAAHERLLYDKLVESVDNGNVVIQDLLVPYIYTATRQEIANFESIKERLECIGFDICMFGSNGIKVSALPAILINIDIGKFLSEILDNKEKITVSDMAKNKLAVCACRSAIKGGDSLNEAQIASFMDKFACGKNPLMCPHGRPTYLEYTKYDIEKAFKRKL